jgi:hypothetical protein
MVSMRKRKPAAKPTNRRAATEDNQGVGKEKERGTWPLETWGLSMAEREPSQPA